MRSCLVCDDHALVREALAGMVRLGWPGIDVAEAADFPAAWAHAERGFDVCIADLAMPGATPLDGIDGLRRAGPGMPILIVTGAQDDALLLALLERGVAGFAPKTSTGGIIEAALRLILAGGRYLPPRLAQIAASQRDVAAAPPATREAAAGDRMTARQLAVLRLVAGGRSNKEIAQALDLAPSTVKTHLAQIQAALGAKNRTEAAIRARSLDLL